MIHAKALALAISALMTPAGGYHGPYAQHGQPAQFKVGAATASFSPPLRGHAPGGDPADCDHTGAFNGPRQFAYEEPYKDLQHHGHYDLGDPFKDCNGNRRWDGNLLGGGGNTPRFYDHVADSVGARAMVVSAGGRRIAVEVVDQEGLFNIYQQRIRAKVLADGFHLSDIFISATHDESAPDSLGLGGVSPDDLGRQRLLGQLHGPPERAGDRARRPSRAPGADPLHRGARALERPSMLVLVSVRRRPAHPGARGGQRPRPRDRHAGQRQPARRDARLQRRHAGARRPEQLGLLGLDPLLPQLAPAAARRRRDRDGGLGRLGREPRGLPEPDLARCRR